jgi:hypothetical protein
VGLDEAKLAPHQLVVDAGQAQCETCAACEKNKWGSANTGKGKACKNTRMLALVSAGGLTGKAGEKGVKFTLEDDLEAFASQPVGLLKPPVTSIKGFATYVKQVAAMLKRPPHGVITRLEVVPNAKNQFEMKFSGLDEVPDAFMPAVMKHRLAAAPLLDQPFNLGSGEAEDEGGEDTAPKAPARRAPPPPAKGGKAKKY